jgi:hypothetical protein
MRGSTTPETKTAMKGTADLERINTDVILETHLTVTSIGTSNYKIKRLNGNDQNTAIEKRMNAECLHQIGGHATVADTEC